MRYLLALLTLPLLALDNSKTVYNQTAATMTARVITLHWYLAQGEISSFPRPYLTPSDTSTRAAAASWQVDIKNRWRDGSETRSITDVQPADPAYTIGGALVRVAVDAAGIGTVTTNVPHGRSVGDRITISGATGDLDLNRDHYIVLTVPTSTTFTIATQSVSALTFTNAGLTVRHAIEPGGSGLCYVKSPNHRLEVSEQVTIAGVDGITGVNGTWRVTAVARDSFLINTTCTGVYTGNGTVTGPAFGSVQVADVSVVATIPASGSVRVDLVDNPNACHLGDVATCRAAGLDKSGMLAFAGGTWDASLSLTANARPGSTGTITRSARTMLSGWDGVESYCRPRYWLRGPLVTQLILEYGCAGELTYDLGWKIVPGSNTTEAIASTTQTQFNVNDASTLPVGARLWFLGSGGNQEHMTVTGVAGNTLVVTRGVDGSTPQTYATGKVFGTLDWTDASDDGFKSLHPAFVLTFPSGWSGVRVETRVENTYMDKQQGMWYAPTITVDGVTRFTRTEMKHAARERWRKVFWSGANGDVWCGAGGGTDGDDCAGSGGGARALQMRVDHNTDYLVYSKALLAWPRVPTSDSTYYWVNGFSSPGWVSSDKGDVGVEKWMAYKDFGNYAKPRYPLLHVGSGTWGADSVSSKVGERDFTANGIQEGWPLPVALVLWAQSWDLGGYELLFGVSVPGGAGNAEVENHIPWQRRESSRTTPYVAGWPDSAFSRWISTHTRPGMATSNGNHYATSTNWPADAPRVTCYTTSNTVATSTVKSVSAAWPCGLENEDGWLYETAHVNDWAWMAWLVSGEEWWVQTLWGKGSWASGVGHAVVGRNPGKIWAWSIKNDLIRNESWGTQAMQYALHASPTELMFGQTSTPERNLFLANVWDGALFAEGLTGQTDGWAAILYGPLFSSSCAGYPTTDPATNLNNPISSNRYLYGRCSKGLGPASNPLGIYPPVITVAPCVSVHLRCADRVTYQTGLWQISDSSSAWHAARDHGFPGYDHVRRMIGRVVVNATLNRNHNGYLWGQKDTAGLMSTTGQVPQTYAEWASGFQDEALAKNSWAAIGGSAALTIGYSWRSATLPPFYTDIVDSTTPGCTPAERPPIGCTGRMANEWFRQTLLNQRDAFATQGYPKNYIRERPEVRNVRTSVSAGTATINWLAPDNATCTVGINPDSSLDATDSPAVAVGRVQSFSTSASTGSVVRITCGQARTQRTL